MANQALVEVILHGREDRNREYKCSMNWKESNTKAKVIKSAMAMANIPDGGAIVFGVEQNGETFTPQGMNPEDADSFAQDDVMAKVNEYADPCVELTVTQVDNDGKRFVVIQVKAFDQLPVVCRKDGQELKRGTIYTRSRRKYETAAVSSESEMREILDRAMDIQLITLKRRGLVSLSGGISAGPTDKARFEEQLGGL